MNALLLVLMLAVPKTDQPNMPKIGEHSAMLIDPPSGPVFLCPQDPGDPPWRPMTCWMMARLGIPPDPDFVDVKTAKPWVPDWKPVNDNGYGGG
jgi:hypothetical protein